METTGTVTADRPPRAPGRRRFLAGGLAAGLWPLVPSGVAAAAREPAGTAPGVPRPAVHLVPGYVHESARFRGRPLTEQPRFTKAVPKDYGGYLTMVTRVDEADGSVARALFPLSGHEITVHPDGTAAFFNAMDDVIMATFDPRSLEPGVLAAPHHGNYTGGGHALTAPDRLHLVETERRTYLPYSGRPEDHFGRVVIRDWQTLKVVEVFDSGGMAPHQIRLLDGGRLVAIAHYGSAEWPDGDDRQGLPYIVQPCLTVLELASGKLVHKVLSPDRRFDLRHLAVRGLDGIFAIQGRLAPIEEAEATMAGWEGVYEPDIWSGGEEIAYLPAPLLRFDATRDPVAVTAHRTADPLLMRYGQTIVYDPVHDEAIATYPSNNCVIVFAGADGAVKRVIRTDRLGLQQPRGISLHPDGAHYVVSGYWRHIFQFRRGSHDLVRDRCRYLTLFGHSHSTVV